MAAEIRITINSQSGGSGVADAKQDLQDLGQAAEKSGGGFSALKEIGIGALRELGAAALNLAVSGLQAVAGAISEGITDARENAKIQAQTAAVIKSTGNAAGVTAEQVADMASALSDAAGKSLFGDDQIQQSTNLLLTFTNIKGAALEAATAMTVDMAQAMGGDPKDAAIQLGKALNDPIKGITALSRVGVTFSQDQKDVIQAMVDTGDIAGAQAVILEELNKEFGGSAEAAAKADGGWAQFNARLGEAKESIGTAILPLLSTLAGFLNDTVAPAVEQLAAAFSAWLSDPQTQAQIAAITAAIQTGLAVAFDFIANTAIPALLAAWAALQPALAIVQGVFTSAGDSASGLGMVIATLTGIWEHIQQVINVVAPAIQAVVNTVFGQIQTFLNAHGTEIQAFISTTWNTIAEIIHLALDLIQATVVPVLTFIADFINTHGTEIQTILGAVWSNIQTIISTALEIIKGIITTALQLINGDFSGAWETIKGMCATFVLALWTIFNNAWTIIKTLFSSSLNAIWTNIQTIFNTISTAVTTFFTTAYTNFFVGLNTIKTYWYTFWETLYTDFQATLNGITGWVIQTMQAVANAIRQWSTAAASAAASVGQSIIDGIVGGIKDGADKIISAAKDAAMSALHAAESALGIGSPSKVFAQGIGLPMAQGMAQGLLGGAPLVAQAASVTAGAGFGAAADRTYNQQRSMTYAPVYNVTKEPDTGMDAAFARSLAGAV